MFDDILTLTLTLTFAWNQVYCNLHPSAALDPYTKHGTSFHFGF